MKVTLNIKKRYAYSILGLLILGLGFLFVNAYVLVPGETPNPGHPISQVGPPADCEDGQVLQFINQDTGWGCVDLPEGASTMVWSDITGKPAGFADNVDNSLIKGEALYSCPVYTHTYGSCGSCPTNCVGQTSTASTCSYEIFTSWATCTCGESYNKDCSLIGYFVN